jgi:PPOX class probable F420-dependent enzyme
MKEKEVNRFLSLPYIAKLATTNPDGSPQISPVWFIREEGRGILISTYKEALKVRNIRRNPTVSVLVDHDGGGLELKGILMRGTATLVEGPECSKIVKKIYDKYLPTKITRKSRAAAAYKEAVISQSDSYICVKVTPRTISTWNYSRIRAEDATALTESTRPYETTKATKILG